MRHSSGFNLFLIEPITIVSPVFNELETGYLFGLRDNDNDVN